MPNSQYFPGLCPEPHCGPSEQGPQTPLLHSSEIHIWAKQPKLEISGSHPGGVAFDWFKNYLSDRTQCATINNEKSEIQTIKYGIPQSSLLFLTKIIKLIFNIANHGGRKFFSLDCLK